MQRLRDGWNSLRKKKWFGLVLSVGGTLGTLILALYPEWIKGPLDKYMPLLAHYFELHRSSLMPLALISGWCVALWAWHDGQKRAHVIDGLKAQISSLTKEIPNRRWDTIRNVVYGHVEYDPFLKYVHGHKDPDGFGPYYLNMLLGSSKLPGSPRLIEAKAETRRRDWGSVFDEMAPGVCDVIATPLFATFDRSSKVRFTAPLFFSNIGLYMNKDALSRTFLEGISVQNLTERLRDGGHTSKDLQFLSIKGEISEKMAMKYAGWMVDDRVGQFLISGLLNEVASGGLPSRALFCESYIADQMIEELRRERTEAGGAPFPAVANVLPAQSILYPVCFAVPYGDYELANLLNIRLLQFTQKKSALDELAEWLAKDRGLVDTVDKKDRSNFIKDVKKHFVAAWPLEIDKDGTDG